MYIIAAFVESAILSYSCHSLLWAANNFDYPCASECIRGVPHSPFMSRRQQKAHGAKKKYIGDIRMENERERKLYGRKCV